MSFVVEGGKKSGYVSVMVWDGWEQKFQVSFILNLDPLHRPHLVISIIYGKLTLTVCVKNKEYLLDERSEFCTTRRNHDVLTRCDASLLARHPPQRCSTSSPTRCRTGPLYIWLLPTIICRRIHDLFLENSS